MVPTSTACVTASHLQTRVRYSQGIACYCRVIQYYEIHPIVHSGLRSIDSGAEEVYPNGGERLTGSPRPIKGPVAGLRRGTIDRQPKSLPAEDLDERSSPSQRAATRQVCPVMV
jgi:hypothetical protein